MTFTIRIEDFELRSCNKNLISEGEHTRGEIVQWAKHSTHCWTVAYWDEGSEGYDLRFVGDRPFKCDPETFFVLARMGQDFLQQYWSIKNES